MGFVHMMTVDDPTPANLMDSGLTLVASVDDGQLDELPELKQNIRQLMKKVNANSEPRASIESDRNCIQYIHSP